ncbi:hypothetical protein [Aureimonas psammosilenae]|uniref:hypothetical protein n=1 Tax=Aureimonas psammosilenae TaxID=2495496 RepID=UPI00126119A1|nr:hypothetical protein [Aureimonas psammosilenae]
MADRRSSQPTQLFLKGARVTSAFRASLFDAANRAGVTPNEFVIQAAAEKLARSGASFPGVFRVGDQSDLKEAA